MEPPGYSCPICLEELLDAPAGVLDPQMQVEWLICTHAFHRHCLQHLQQVGSRQITCPVCHTCAGGRARVLVLIENSRNVILVQEWNGRWTLPGGSLEPVADQGSLQRCAQRELFEETGLRAPLLDLVEVTPRLQQAYFSWSLRTCSWDVVHQAFTTRSDRQEVHGIWMGYWKEAALWDGWSEEEQMVLQQVASEKGWWSED